MGGYILTRALSGGFLGDHADVGNWRCPLGLGALSVETMLILLAIWQVRIRTRSVPPQSRPATRRTPEFSHSR
jgi:hypothetical protein